MITYYVKQSKVYTVTSPAECVIYDKNDKKVGTCGAGASVDVTATTSQLKLSVDSAVLTPRVKESEVTDTINEHVADTSVHLTPAEKSRIEYADDNYARRKEVNYFDKTNTFRAFTYLEGGVYVLPLGTTTALGAPAYGLSVTADGGLQLWGTHFMQGSIWGENGLKMVQNEVSLTSTDSAAIGFDFANNVVFRTMPNDGDGHGVYRFECWKWEDDSHTQKVLGACDVQKNNAKELHNESLLNLSELNDYFLRKNFRLDQHVGSFVTFGNGIGTDSLSLGSVFLVEGRVNGGVQALQLGNNLATGAAEHGLSAVDVWASGEVRSYSSNGYVMLRTVSNSSASPYSELMSTVPLKINAPEVIVSSNLSVDLLSLGSITFGVPEAGILADGNDGHLKISGMGIDLISSDTEVTFNGKTLDEIVEAKVNAVLTEKGLI